MGNPSRFRVPPAEIRSQKSRPNEFSLSLRLLSIPLGQFFQVAKDASTEMGTSPRSIWACSSIDFTLLVHCHLHSAEAFQSLYPLERELSICYSTPLETIRNAIAITYPRGILSWQTSTAVDTRLVRLVMMLVGLLQSWKLWRPWSSALSIAWHRSTPSLQLSRMVLTPFCISYRMQSSFSSGGNMAFTVPLRLQGEICRRMERSNEGQLATYLPRSDVRLAVIMSWYPTTDFATNTRVERRKTNIRPDKELPKFFTQLFDASYLYPPHSASLSDPYLSPGVAPDDMLRALPNDIIIYTCEWDGLRAEAERFKERLTQALEKRVRYRMVVGVSHAWDKSPNPFKRSFTRDDAYREACIEVKRVFNSNE